jgi:hypothetical protein
MTSFADMRPEHTLMIIGRLSLGGWGVKRETWSTIISLSRMYVDGAHNQEARCLNPFPAFSYVFWHLFS